MPNNHSKNNIIYVINGPSSSGKTSTIEEYLEKYTPEYEHKHIDRMFGFTANHVVGDATIPEEDIEGVILERLAGSLLRYTENEEILLESTITRSEQGKLLRNMLDEVANDREVIFIEIWCNEQAVRDRFAKRSDGRRLETTLEIHSTFDRSLPYVGNIDNSDLTIKQSAEQLHELISKKQ